MSKQTDNNEANTVISLSNMKANKEKISQLTCYDYTTAKIMDPYVDMIHVGDSLGMVMQGAKDTLSVSMDEMIIYARSVVRAASSAFVSVDMPFMSYQISDEQALENAGRIISESGAAAVKLEGGRNIASAVKKITQAGIPVIGHIGMTPQYMHSFGGFKLQGAVNEQAARLIEDAIAIEEAGAFAITLECIPAKLAALITKKLDIITIGIGAGPDCDGQVLVYQDMLSMPDVPSTKFVKAYGNIGKEMAAAFEAYNTDVKQGKFPSKEYSFAGNKIDDNFMELLYKKYF